MSQQEEANFVEHIPCDECGSSDANSLYDDGHTHCFACDTTVQPKDLERKPSKKSSPRGTPLIDGHPQALGKRKLSQESCKLWDYHVGTYEALGDKDAHLDGKKIQIANYCDERGRPVFQKIRFADKTFTTRGDKKQLGLYGKHLWRDSGKKIIITEGELDAISVSQLQGHKWAVVSVPNGAQGAKKALVKELEWLQRFDEVILMFDDDEAGLAAVEECTPLFSPGKCKVARIEGYKDASDALQAGDGGSVIDAIWAAKVFAPDGIYSAGEVLDNTPDEIKRGLSFPWETMTYLTFGMRPHEMYAYGAGTGVGKTDTLKEIIAHIINVHKQKVGTLLFEEPDLRQTIHSVAGKIDGAIYHVPDIEFDKSQRDATCALLRDELFLYDIKGSDVDREKLLALIRYFVLALGCEHIFLDHVTFMLDAEDDERQLEAQKKLMRRLNDLNKELPFTLHYVSHLRKANNGRKPHEEGGRVFLDDFLGGKATTQYANFVIGVERDQQGDDKNSSYLRFLKDRYTGRATGRGISLRYDEKTGKKVEQEDDPFAEDTESNTEHEEF